MPTVPISLTDVNHFKTFLPHSAFTRKTHARREIYHRKFKALWNGIFGVFGLKVPDPASGETGKSKTTLLKIGFLVLSQIVLSTHFFAGIIYNATVTHNIQGVAYFLSITINCVFANFLLYTFYRRKQKLSALEDEVVQPIIKSQISLKKVWITTLVTIGTLEFFVLAAFAAAAAGNATCDRETCESLVQLYFVGAKPEGAKLNCFRIILVVEFVILCINLFLVDVNITYFNYICQLLTLNFKIFNRELSSALQDGVGLFTSFKINYFRRKHQRICEWVNEFSSVFSPLLFLCLLGMIANICFDLRALKGNATILYLICYACAASRHVLVLFSIAYNTTFVNREAHRMAEAISTSVIIEPPRSNCPNQTNTFHVNFNLFSKRLLNSTIGINVSQLFVLTAVTFMSMFGTVLTYVIILYQTP